MHVAAICCFWSINENEHHLLSACAAARCALVGVTSAHRAQRTCWISISRSTLAFSASEKRYFFSIVLIAT